MTVLRDYIRRIRPPRRPVYLKLHFAPGECAQVDWGAQGTVAVGKAMLDFAVKLTEAPDKIENADRDVLRQLGFPDRDIWDIAAATDMRPNAEYYAMARTKKAE